MKKLDMKLISTPVTVEDDNGGKATFWFTDYTTLHNDFVMREFDRICPRSHPIRDEKGNAELDTSGKPKLGWTSLEYGFALLEGRVPEVEINLDGAPAYLRGLAAYYKARNGSIEDNWQAYQQFVGADAISLLDKAWGARPSSTMNAPKEIREGNSADPQS